MENKECVKKALFIVAKKSDANKLARKLGYAEKAISLEEAAHLDKPTLLQKVLSYVLPFIRKNEHLTILDTTMKMVAKNRENLKTFAGQRNVADGMVQCYFIVGRKKMKSDCFTELTSNDEVVALPRYMPEITHFIFSETWVTSGKKSYISMRNISGKTGQVVVL